MIWIDTDGRHGGQTWQLVVKVSGLVAHLPHLALGVLAFEGGEVDHAKRHAQALFLCRILDAALGESGHPFLNAYLVNGGLP